MKQFITFIHAIFSAFFGIFFLVLLGCAIKDKDTLDNWQYVAIVCAIGALVNFRSAYIVMVADEGF